MKKTTEHGEQKTLIRWADLNAGRYPVLARLYAIPNGGHRVKAVAARMKAEGVRRGVPDLCLPYPSHGYSGLYIEMKTRKGRVSREQGEYLEFLRSAGYQAVVCRGWVEAAGVIVDYLGLPAHIKP